MAIAVLAVPATSVAAVNAQAEVATALYSASATQVAFQKLADSAIRQQRERITALETDVSRGDNRRRAELAEQQQLFVARLAAKDRAFAEQIAIFRGAVQDIAKTPAGAEALSQFNAGDRVGALAILDQLRATNDRMRENRIKIESAAEGRQIAKLAIDAREKGDQTAQQVIQRLEEVTGLDPGDASDWVMLARLYPLVGRNDDAVAAALKAVAVVKTPRGKLIALIEVGATAQTRGRLEDAREAYETVLSQARSILAATPQDTEAQEDVAIATARLAAVLVLQSQPSQAARLFAESNAVFRELAQRPERLVSKLGLVSGLINTSDVDLNLGDFVAAERHLTEAVGLVRELDNHGDNVTAQVMLVGARVRIGALKKAQQDLPGARQEAELAVTTARKLATADPSNAQHSLLLADTLIGLGQTDLDQKAFSAADTSLDEALRISRDVVTHDRGGVEAQTKVITSLLALGILAVQQGQFAAALKLFDEAAGFSEQPGGSADATYLTQRRVLILSRRVITLRAQGNIADAQKAADEIVAHTRQLAAIDVTNLAIQHSYSTAIFTLGQLDQDRGNLAGARAKFEEALRIERQTASTDPADVVRRSVEMWAKLSALGEIEMSQGDIQGALIHHTEALETARLAAGVGVATPVRLQNVAASLDRIAAINVVQGDLAAADQRYAELVDIAARAAKAYPEDSQSQMNYASALNYLGGMQTRKGDLAGARATYEQTIAIRRRMYTVEPGRIINGYTFADSLRRLGHLHRRADRLGEARALFAEALLIDRRLAAAAPTLEDVQTSLARSLEGLAQVDEERGQSSEALAAYEETLAIFRGLQQKKGQTSRPISLSIWYALYNIDGILLDRGRIIEARSKADEASALIRGLIASTSGPDEVAERFLSVSLYRSADIAQTIGDADTAAKLFDEALAITRKRLAEDPGHRDRERLTDVTQGLTAYAALKTERESFMAGQQLLAESLALQRAAPDAANPVPQKQLVTSLAGYAGALFGAGSLDEAEAAGREVLARAPTDTPGATPAYIAGSAAARVVLARVLAVRKDPRALELFRDSVSAMRKLVALEPNSVGWRLDLAAALGLQADFLADRGDVVGARAGVAESLALTNEVLKLSPDYARAIRQRSKALVSVAALTNTPADRVAAREAIMQLERRKDMVPSDLVRLAALDPSGAAPAPPIATIAP